MLSFSLITARNNNFTLDCIFFLYLKKALIELFKFVIKLVPGVMAVLSHVLLFAIFNFSNTFPQNEIYDV